MSSEPDDGAQALQAATLRKLRLEAELLAGQLAHAEVAQQVTLDKLRSEARLAADQLTPAYRRRTLISLIAGASGLVLAVIAVLGGLASAYQWFVDQRESREARSYDRMDRALNLLSGERPSQRAAAVTALDIALSNGDQQRNRQIVISIANALPLEKDSSVRNAMVWFFEDIDERAVDVDTLNAALKSLVYVNRGLTKEAGLRQSLAKDWFKIETDIPNGAALQSLARAMTALMKKGARYQDLSGLYLGRSNLSELDLDGTKFDDSILAWTNFTATSLRGASFDGADLEQTEFYSADLRDASFAFTRYDDQGEERTSYVTRQLMNGVNPNLSSLPALRLPDFGCADLRNANFSGQIALGFMSTKNLAVPVDAKVPEPIFQSADLSGTDFSRIRIYAVATDLTELHNMPAPTSYEVLSIRHGDQAYVSIFEMSSGPIETSSATYAKSLQAISQAFVLTNANLAVLPKWLGELLVGNQFNVKDPRSRAHCPRLPS